MIYDVRIPEDERDLLRRLRGLPVESVWTDGWSCFLRFPESTIQIVPEEVPTPSPSHPYADVDRPRLVRTTPDHQGAAAIIARDLGRVQSVAVLEVRLTFSSPTYAAPTEILGVAVPEGATYGPVFLGGSAGTARAADESAPLVGLDLAFELSTDLGRTAVFYTEATGHFVHVAIDAPLPGHLAGFVRRVP